MKLKSIDGGKNVPADKSENIERETMEKIIQIARTGQIPIIKNLPKNAERARINFRCDAQTETLLRILTLKSKTFSTPSELYRAIMEFGTKIFYHLFRDEASEKSTVGEKLFKNLEIIHESQKKLETLVSATRSAKMIYDECQMKIISKRKMNDELNNIVNSLPKQLQTEIRKRISEIKKGQPITNFLVDKNDYFE